MTQITVDQSVNGSYLIVCEGHSGDTRVCAGISAILYGIAGYLDGRREELDRLSYSLKEGLSFVEYDSSEGRCSDAFDMAVTALRQIAESFPENAHINEYKRRKT